MSQPPESGSPNYRRRLVLLAVFIVVLFGGYSGLWWYLADQLKARSATMLSDLSLSSIDAQCEDLEVRGYPFRLGVYCNSVSAVDKRDRSSLTAGGFRSAAQIYKPNHIVSEVDGPVSVVAPTGDSGELDWQNLRTSTVFGLDGLSRGSVQGTDTTAVVKLAASGQTVKLTTGNSEFHTRQSGADLDAVIRIDEGNLAVEPGLDGFPGFSLEADATFSDRAWLLSGHLSADDMPWRDVSGSLNGLLLHFDNGAEIRLSGPFSVDGRGLVSGKFDVNVQQIGKLLETFATVIPGQEETLRNAAGMLSGVRSGGDGIKLPLTIDRGRVSIAFFSLGRIPPL
jgi:hypothetical protein